LHQCIEAQSGFVFQIVGDSFSAAFHDASKAVNAALEAQRAFRKEDPAIIHSHPLSTDFGPLAVR
jgi:hypothetical protein